MSVAQNILTVVHRTPKERREMAEFWAANDGKSAWDGDCLTCIFSDGSALLMTLDEDLIPTEFLVIDDQQERDAAKLHALACLATGADWDVEELSHNIESNFPNLDPEVIDDIAEKALAL
jgi:hypothetical protein